MSFIGAAESPSMNAANVQTQILGFRKVKRSCAEARPHIMAAPEEGVYYRRGTTGPPVPALIFGKYQIQVQNNCSHTADNSGSLYKEPPCP